MSNTGLDTFDTTLQQSNRLLGEIEKKFGWEDRRQQSYDAFRAVMHTLRDRLPLNESVHLASQLTLLLKGVYYDGWDPSQVPIKMSREEFINKIRQEFVYSIDMEIDQMITEVLQVVTNSIDEGAKQEVISALPPEIASMIN